MIFNENGYIISKDNTLNKIIEFWKKCMEFDYGTWNGNQLELGSSYTSDSLYKFKVSSPIEFIRRKGGNCWDYVIYENDYFKKNFSNISIQSIFIKMVGWMHTFLIFEIDNVYYYFEATMSMYNGIYKFDSIDQLLKTVVRILREEFLLNHDYDIFKYPPVMLEIHQFDGQDKRIWNMKHIEFIYFVEKGKTIFINLPIINDKSVFDKNIQKIKII